MPTLVQNITRADNWFTNANYTIEFYIKQKDEVTAQNIAGWTFSWLLKKNETDADAAAILTKTTAGGGVIIVDGPAGYGHVVISSDDTDTDDGFVPDIYHHELKRTDSGFEAPVIKGTAQVRRSLHING